MKKYILFGVLSLLLVSVVLSGCKTKYVEPEGVGISKDNLKILDHKLEREENEGFAVIKITGTAQNSGSKQLIHASIKADFYGTNGALMDTVVDSTSDLNSNEMWNFEMEYIETEDNEIENYEIVVSTLLEA